ncbi:MAG: hypothetical protein D6748_14500 [Calditrichaeota bacterium]|nr:MAG: hypothetical protein D6748_14500 [Calditrichota bacterium]
MRTIFKMLIILLFFSSLSFCQQKRMASSPNRILKNWVSAQVGELAGWGLTGLTLRIAEGINIINFNSENSRNKTYIFTGVLVGNFAGNYFLKRTADQNGETFIKNLFFSATPVVLYGLIVQPKFKDNRKIWVKYRDEIGLMLTSMFLTPILSTIGNELFNKNFIHTTEGTGIKVQLYATTKERTPQIGMFFRF